MKNRHIVQWAWIGILLLATTAIAMDPPLPKISPAEKRRSVFEGKNVNEIVNFDLTKVALHDVLRDSPLPIVSVKADGEFANRKANEPGRLRDRVTLIPNRKGNFSCTIAMSLTDQHLEYFAKHPGIVDFEICDSEIADVGFAALARLPELRSLRVHTTETIDLAAVAHLAKCIKLQHLSLRGVSLPNDAGKSLAQLPALRSFALTKGELGQEVLAEFAARPRLQRLYLDGVRIPQGSVAAISRMKDLSSLTLTGVRLSDEDFQAIRELPKLESVELVGTNLQNKHLEGWERLTELKWVDLAATQVDIAGLLQLRGNPKLKAMNGDGLNVSDADQRKLANLYGWSFTGFCSCGCADIGPLPGYPKEPRKF